MLQQFLNKIIYYDDLTAEDLNDAFDIILQNECPEQTAAFLALMHYKGETSFEIRHAVQYMRTKMHTVSCATPVLDIVGTGGDGFNTVNISTASSLLAASCGVKVLKHGNRSVSSLTGSADLIQELGYNLDISRKGIEKLIAEYNFAFCFAPTFHPSFAAIKVLRRKLGFSTIFNLIGPLLNPGNAEYFMVGVSDISYLVTIAKALQQLDVKHAIVFNCQGLDELCTVGVVDIVEVSQDKLHTYQFNPEDYGFQLCSVADLKGGDSACNAKLLKNALQGGTGAISDTLVLNAGFACCIYGVANSIEDGICLAREKQRSGVAYKLMCQVMNASQDGREFN